MTLLKYQNMDGDQYLEFVLCSVKFDYQVKGTNLSHPSDKKQLKIRKTVNSGLADHKILNDGIFMRDCFRCKLLSHERKTRS